MYKELHPKEPRTTSKLNTKKLAYLNQTSNAKLPTIPIIKTFFDPYLSIHIPIKKLNITEHISINVKLIPAHAKKIKLKNKRILFLTLTVLGI